MTQARLAAIVESSDDAIVSKNLDGIVTSWNKGAERIFGWTGGEMVGQSITKIIPPDRQQEEVHILERLRRGDRIDHFETIRVTKNGTLLNVSVTISPIRDSTGRIIGASKIARDITLQKRFQQELEDARQVADEARQEAERAKEEAETANQAKDYFLSVLSHELRTPLSPVLGAIDLMQQDSTLRPEVLELVSLIRRNVETEMRLVADLLDVTRISRGKVELHFEVLDIHAVIRTVVSMLQREMDAKGLTVTLSLRARKNHVWADPDRFQQILLNLMSNAVKFTPDDGMITIRTSNENGTVKVDVIDTGIGIEPQVLPRLFQPFEQGEREVTRQYGGLGLGLSIVKSLVEMHKASISAASEGKGKGSTFTVRVDSVAVSPHSMHPLHVSAPSERPYRILLVEDNADTRQIMGKLLRSTGCDVVTAGSVKEAIAAAERDSFDVLLSDIGLPDGSGMDIMKYVAKRQSKLKGIALSGYGQDDDLRRSKEAGFITHLTKPVDLQTLHDVIRKVIE